MNEYGFPQAELCKTGLSGSEFSALIEKHFSGRLGCTCMKMNARMMLELWCQGQEFQPYVDTTGDPETSDRGYGHTTFHGCVLDTYEIHGCTLAGESPFDCVT